MELKTVCGADIATLTMDAKRLPRRDLFSEIEEFCASDRRGYVLCLSGLRRTGKTTLMLQMMANLPQDKVIYIEPSKATRMDDICNALEQARKNGVKYAFIDEVTRLPEFIDDACIFADIYSKLDMRVILSGTDSLKFIMAESESLYDRCYTISTTYMPYAEYARVIGGDIDDYLRKGGIFKGDLNPDAYVWSSIALNIQHALETYRDGNHFRNLYDIYDDDELTSAINRVMNDDQCRFILRVLQERMYKPADFGAALSNMGDVKRKRKLTDLLQDNLVKMFKSRLRIKNKAEARNILTDAHVKEIRSYLRLIDMFDECREFYADSMTFSDVRNLIVQPALRWAHVESILDSLRQMPELEVVEDVDVLIEYIKGHAYGVLLEDMAILNTKRSLAPKRYEVFPVKFAIGEIDMIVCDRQNKDFKAFEIKHASGFQSDKHLRHLCNEDNFNMLAQHPLLKNCSGKYVLYAGGTSEEYVNIGEYLTNITMGNLDFLEDGPATCSETRR